LFEKFYSGRINSIQQENVEGRHGLETRHKVPDALQRRLDVGE
jgi:hypothetical protein